MLQQQQQQRKDENVNNLDNFQSKSRLHFIGSWINEASGMIRKILDQNPEYDHSSFFGEQNIVCHIDMDCFFVLVALSKPENAHLRDKPVAVASGGNYSEISSCSYKAREYGVRASMWLHEAKKVCPELQLVKYDFDRVRAINEMIYKSAFELCPNGTHMKLQVISVDEFFVAFDTKNFELARRFCEDLREKIFRESNGCTASCGIAPNVHVARAVTDLAKPNGIKLVSDDECLKFVREMQVDSIHGVGRKMQEKIKNMLAMEKIEPTGIPKKKKKVAQPQQQLPQRRKREEEDEDDDDEIPLLNDDEETENDQPQMMMMNNNNNNEEESNNKERVIVIRDLLPLSLSKLKHYLGQAMAEKLHNLAHKALDHTLVVGTGTSDSGAIPKAVGTTMNYAVRLNQLHEFSGLLLQLCKDIEGKLERVGGAALIVKLTVLVRHPEASVQTKKHLGCGWCDEYVLGQAKAISSEVAFTKAEKIHDTLLPFAMKVIYVDRSEGKKDQDEDQNDGEELESKEKINTWRPAQRFVVTNENINSHNILITDLRGITLNASSIIPKVKSKTGINGKKIQQQISIADSFRKQQQKNQQQKHQEDENKNIFISDDDENFIEDDEDCDDDDDELKVVSSSRRKKNNQHNDGVIVLCSQDGSAAAGKKNNKTSSATATIAVSSQDDLDDDDEILVMSESPNKTKNGNHQLMSSSTYTVISSQENEDDDILVSDSRDGAPSASSNSKNTNRDKNPQNKKQVTFAEKSNKTTSSSGTTTTTVANTSAKSKIMAQAKELVDKNFFFSRENPLCMMSVILVAAKNGKIMNILSSKDPKNEDFRKQAAEFVLRESSNSDAGPLGIKLICANDNKKGNSFTEEEIAMAKRILQ